MTPPPDPSPAALPLADVRVFEIGTSVAAPYATWILAALGADVIKVERPGAGDDARQWGEILPDGMSSIFAALNRDKRAIAVDLKDPEQRARLTGIITDTADVVLQNLRPGLIARYGLDDESLRARAPGLVYCNIWAFGRHGPLSRHPGYDPLMQAYGGIMSVTGELDRAPVRVGTSLIDMGTGMWCAMGILAALRRRDQTGAGSVVDTSLFETSLGWMTYHAVSQQATGRSPVRLGSGAAGMVPYQCYRCADGYLMVAAPNDKLFRLLCDALEHPQWVGDPRFATNQDRYRNMHALNAQIEAAMAVATRAHWRERLEAAGVPCAPEQDTEEMMRDPQTRALGMFQRLPGETLELMGLPISFDGQRPPLRRMPPTVGQHDAEILGARPERAKE